MVGVTLMLTIFNTLPVSHARGEEATSENRAAETDISERISPTDAARVFERVALFVRTGEDPGATGVRVSVASVGLRVRGVLIGEGSAWDVDDPVGEAMREARRSGVQRSGDGTGVWSIELDLGGAWTPRVAPTWSELGSFAKPGVRGTAARLGTGENATSDVLTPSQQLRFGMGPLGVWRRVSTGAGAPLGLLGDVVRETGLRLYSFECTRMSQRDALSPVEFPHRAADMVELSAVTTGGLRERAEMMARFLVARRWLGERALGMSGDVRLHAVDRQAEVAPLRAQMGAALALARFARTAGMGEESLAAARSASEGVLLDALTVEPGETLFVDDPIAAAGYMVALAELTRSGPVEPALMDAVVRTRELVASFGAGPEGARVEADVAALVALALLRDATDLEGPDVHREVGSTVARALIADLGGEGAHSAMPWLGWALVESSTGLERVAGDTALRASRDLSERLQANDLLLDDQDRDLVGGFLWGEDARAYPDWRSAKTGAMLGILLGDERLTPSEERALRLDRVRRSCRFLMQLMVDGDDAWRVPAGRVARGGVRETVWGDTAGIETTALALIALCEALDGVARAFSD